MADAADSKSAVGNHVRVQVPFPAFFMQVKAFPHRLEMLFLWDFMDRCDIIIQQAGMHRGCLQAEMHVNLLDKQT